MKYIFIYLRVCVCVRACVCVCVNYPNLHKLKIYNNNNKK